MAAPEIKLPPPPKEPLLYTTPGVDDHSEHQETYQGLPIDSRTTSSTGLNSKSIVYHYLNFDTELPLSSRTKALHEAVGVVEPPPPDLQNYISPFEWPEARKTYTTWLSCAVTVLTAYTAGSYSPATEQMMEAWHVGQTAIYAGIATFTTGFATTPMILAPFSEINGRRPVFIATGTLFVICQLCCALTRSYAGMLVARFFTGVGGSTFSTMFGGVVSDIYQAEDRNKPLALFAGAALLGTGLGPLCSGFIAQHLLWRWIFYIQVMTSGFLIILVAVFFQETRGSVLLSRRARLLNDWYEARERIGLVGFEMPIGDAVKNKAKGSDGKSKRTRRGRAKSR
ncbi:MAG: hypothetical protein Q9166_003778 [cf. Caloplaca sp. 2 TL-2023]